MEDKYNVIVNVRNEEDGEEMEYEATVEFSYTPNDYGNGHYMGLRSFGSLEAYDIRYDSDFQRDNKPSYITQFFQNRHSGKNHSWKLTGISIKEAK